MLYAGKCLMCRKEVEIVIPDAQYDAWMGGAFVQDAMPDMPADDREFLISRTCGPCFDAIFQEDDEE